MTKSRKGGRKVTQCLSMVKGVEVIQDWGQETFLLMKLDKIK
jgi:hypothetical protein